MMKLIRPLVELSGSSANGHEFYGMFGGEFPTGSVKYVSVLGMLAHLTNTVGIDRIKTVYASTSGNTGAAAAYICNEAGFNFVAVVDRKIEKEKAQKIAEYGGRVVSVEEGGVHERIRLARELSEQDSFGVDLDQYSNPGALLGHFQITGPMIWSAMHGQLDAVVIAIGTGGTFGGTVAYLTQQNPDLFTIPVDAEGSAITGGEPRTRQLTGIGCAFIPENVRRAYQFIRSNPQTVSDRDAFVAARWFRDFEGIGIGGSGGAVVKAALRVAEATTNKRILLLFSDGGAAYQSTVYSDEWMTKQGFTFNDKTEVTNHV